MEPPLATLIHISDLHFGKKFTTDVTLFRRIVANLPFVQGLYVHSYKAARALAERVNQILLDRNQHKVPACVVVTGDLTGAGKAAEIDVAMKYLREAHPTHAGEPVGLRLGDPQDTIELTPAGDWHAGLFEIPGNHDIWQSDDPSQLAEYLDYFGSDFPSICVIKTPSRPVLLYGLNSNESTKMKSRLAIGHIRERQLSDLCEVLEGVRAHPTHPIQIVCLHHPLGDQGHSGVEIGMKLEEREHVARQLLKAGAHLVLAGHVHSHYFLDSTATSPPHVVAGTATQQSAEHNFWLIDLYATSIHLKPFVDTKDKRGFIMDRGGEHIIPIPRAAPSGPSAPPIIPEKGGRVLRVGSVWLPRRGSRLSP